MWVARHDIPGILQKTGTDVHPPLYFTLLHLWRSFGGDSEFALRLLAAMLGTLTIPAIYLLGKTIGGKKTGLLAALLLTFSRFNIAWSQEIRMYALASLLAALGVWAAIQVWERGRWQDYAGYIACMTAGLLTLYLFFPIPVAINVGWLWVAWPSRANWRGWWRWLAAQATILFIVGIWLSFALRGFLSTSSATPVGVWDFLKTYWTVLTVGIPLNVDAYARVTIPVLVVFLLGLATLLAVARHNRRHARHLALLLTGLLIPVAIVYYIAIPKVGSYAPPFAPRYLVIFSGYYVILLAWGLVTWGNGRFLTPHSPFSRLRLLTPLFILAVLYASAVGLRDYHQGRMLVDDYKSLARALAVYEQPHDAVVLFTDTDWPIWAYHHPGAWHGVPHAWQITAAG
ncbi:MAG: glycosyltransferase family 39 protein [Chloroflexota bacterium]